MENPEILDHTLKNKTKQTKAPTKLSKQIQSKAHEKNLKNT